MLTPGTLSYRSQRKQGKMSSARQDLNLSDLHEYLDALIDSILDTYCTTQKIDHDQVERLMRQVYKESGRATPLFKWFSSPRELRKASGKEEGPNENFHVSQIEEKCAKKIRLALEEAIDQGDFEVFFRELWERLRRLEIHALARHVPAELVAKAPNAVINQRMPIDWNIAASISGYQEDESLHHLEWTSVSLTRLAIAQAACELFELEISEVEKYSFDNLLSLARSAHTYLCFEKVCMLSERPLEYHNDDQFRLHHPNGPAVVYGDGFKIYSWHGARMPESIMTCEATLSAIENEDNIELRRVLIARYGLQRYLLDTGAEIRHHDKFGSLYVKEVWNDEDIVMVHITNSSPEPDGEFRNYFLRVPPNMSTAHEAVAWTFGMNPADYEPLEES